MATYTYAIGKAVGSDEPGNYIFRNGIVIAEIVDDKECVEIGESIAELEAENARLKNALQELAELMQGVIDGTYTPDSFTLQPARAALSK